MTVLETAQFQLYPQLFMILTLLLIKESSISFLSSLCQEFHRLENIVKY